MKRKAKIFISIVIVFVAIFTSNHLATAKTWTFQSIDDVNKAWSIRFNHPIDINSMTTANVYIADGNSKHLATLKLAGNGHEIEVHPSIPYTVGKQYFVMITKNVKTADGKFLKVPIEVPFQVVDSTEKIQSIFSISGGIITEFTVHTSQDVHKITIAGTEMLYKGNNVYTSTAVDLKPGAKVSFVAYDGDNKVVQRKTYTIPN